MTEKKRFEHVLFAGIINVTGLPDTGKTTFALENGAPPEKICFIDDDIKGQAIATEFENLGSPFGKYVNLVAETDGMLENDFHKYCIDLVNNIEVGQYECIVWDNFSRFENSFHPWVLTHQGDFRKHWSPMGAIHGSQIWQAAGEYEGQILDTLQGKAPLVIVTSHMKNENVGGSRTGKMIPDVKKAVIQKATMRVLLRHSDDGSPIPTGLILKRISKRIVTDGKIETVNILPRKIVHLTWDKVREYYNNPVGNRPPTSEELPNQYEMSMLDSTILTDDQRLVMRLAIEGSFDNEEDEGMVTMKSQMQAMKDEGKSLPQIADAFDTDIKAVAKILSS